MAAKGTRAKKIEQTEAQTVLMNIKSLNMNDLVKSCGDLQLTLQSTLSGLQGQFTNKMTQLQELDEAIAIKQSRLKELHEIENEAIQIDEIRAIKDEAEKTFQATIAVRDKEWHEQEVERQKKWQRDGEEWAYKFLQQQKKATDDNEAQLVQKKRAEEIRQEQLTKAWMDRENALKTKEQEFEQLKAQVASFDAILKSEVAKAEAIVNNSVKKHYEYEISALKKDMAGEASMAKVRADGYEKTIAGLNEEIKDIKAQLSIARQDAKEIASSALNSASGRQVSEVLQKVMDSNREPPSKK